MIRFDHKKKCPGQIQTPFRAGATVMVKFLTVKRKIATIALIVVENRFEIDNTTSDEIEA